MNKISKFILNIIFAGVVIASFVWAIIYDYHDVNEYWQVLKIEIETTEITDNYVYVSFFFNFTHHHPTANQTLNLDEIYISPYTGVESWDYDKEISIQAESISIVSINNAELVKDNLYSIPPIMREFDFLLEDGDGIDIRMDFILEKQVFNGSSQKPFCLIYMSRMMRVVEIFL